MNLRKVMVGVAFLTSLAAFRAHAVDLTHRLGVGYKNQFAHDLPRIAVQYYPSASFGTSLALGIDTETDQSKFGLMGRLYRIIFTEKNMNFYMGGGLGVISMEQNNRNDSGFEMSGFLGGEFFFPGLESLGFTFEAGVGVVSVSSETRFRTFGDSPLRGGMIFYF